MKNVGKYWAIAVVSAKSNLAYAGEVWSRLFFLGVILYIFMRLWKVVFAHSHVSAFAGYTVDDIIWYLAFTEAIMMSAPPVAPRVDEDVRTGSIAVQLVRPLSYPLYRLAATLGERTVRFAVTAFAAVVIALVLAKPPEHFATGALFALIALPGAFLLDFLGFLLVGLSAFWLEDTYGPSLIYSRATMLLGGMMLPLDLFPAGFQLALKALPFGYIVCGPAQQLVHPDPLLLAGLLANQLLWLAVFSVAVAAVYSKALHKVALNGG